MKYFYVSTQNCTNYRDLRIPKLERMKSRLKKIFQFKYLVVLYVLVVGITTAQTYAIPTKIFEEEPSIVYTTYNNYIIFKQSFYHLLAGQDIYIHYPSEHWDLYKYSPTFSLLFGPLAGLPDMLGLTIWNLINVLVFAFSIRYLPVLTLRQKNWILLASFVELLTSIQNLQSNGLIAGFLVYSFGFMEREKYGWAALMLVLSVYVKLFGLVGFVLFLFYPHKLKAAGWTLFWGVVLFFLPLLFVGWDSLLSQYESWGRMLANDYDESLGLSVAGWLQSWFGLTPNKNYVVLAGALMLLAPLVQVQKYRQYGFRLLTLSALLIWVVIFNHKAESPTFILAVAGVSIWFFSRERSLINTILFVLVMVFTSFSVTDFFPGAWKGAFLIPYVIKAVPCILVWAKIEFWDAWGASEA